LSRHRDRFSILVLPEPRRYASRRGFFLSLVPKLVPRYISITYFIQRVSRWPD
jgi:hypothetical protein